LAQTAYQSVSGQGEVRDFFALLKPRVMSLVVFTGFAGLAVAPGDLHPVLAAVAILCIAVASGAAGAINMWYDRDIDAVMERTRQRPIPTGKVEPSEALAFGVILASGAVMLMFLATNAVAAGLLAAAVLFYVFVYTMWLKRRTTEHSHRWGCRGIPAGHRLGSGYRRCRYRGRNFVFADLFLDAATFLGFGALPQR
jgi:heme o synthase